MNQVNNFDAVSMQIMQMQFPSEAVVFL